MYFEVLVVDFETPRVVTSAVGDEVFSGAQVLWDKLPRAETLWVVERLSAVVAAWAGPTAQPQRFSLTGTLEGEAGHYALVIDGRTAPDWESLDPASRATVLAELGAILATINGLLEIV
jgi:hypothetical protein